MGSGRIPKMKDFKSEIENITNQIVKHYNPIKIILFGSCANGSNSDKSDIDLLIIKDTDKRPIERIHEAHKPLDYNIPVDILVYTPVEVETLTSDDASFLGHILREGKVLYEC